MRTALIFCILFLMLLLAGPGVWAAPHPGYISDVKNEKEERFYEVYLFVAPPPPAAPLKDAVFNSTLSREFKDRYREKFGQIDTESIVYQQMSFRDLDTNRGADQTQEKQNEQRKEFAEYMLRRLTEWHFDNFFKTEPAMRPLYEAKERISHVEVEVSQDVKFNSQYNFAGNILELIMINPWLDSKLVFEMDPHAIGPSQVNETRVWLGKQLRSDLRINSNAALTDGIGTIEFLKALRDNWGSSFGVSSYFKSEGTSVRETRWLVGFSKSY